MNRIAILADIHGNSPALEAVIQDIAQQHVDQVLVGGDLVGRGPQGNTVVHRVLQLGWPSVRGNHEDYLLGFIQRQVPEEWWLEDVWAASRWMARDLDTSAVTYIESLPFSFIPSTPNPFRLFHGTPIKNNDGIGPWTSDETCLVHLDSIHEHAFACGHTHRPHLRTFPNGFIANVGSVGLPFNGDWRAQYAVFHRDQSDNPWQVEFRQVEYDRGAFLSHYETSGFLEDGHVTARLLWQEIQTARPFLMPFLRWCQNEQQLPTYPSLDLFLETYDPVMPLAELLKPSDSTRSE